MKTKTLLMVAGAGALGYLLWKKIKAEANKPKPSEIRDGEECIANGYTYGGYGIVPHCYDQRKYDANGGVRAPYGIPRT